jgi:hypothetical protein
MAISVPAKVHAFCHSFCVETRGCDHDQYSAWKTPVVNRLDSDQVAQLVKALIDMEKSFEGAGLRTNCLLRNLAEIIADYRSGWSYG